jgi:hypothetical protein
MPMETARIPRAALILGSAGALPFLALAAMHAGGMRSGPFPAPILALTAYGAVILSFLGGVRWGAALRDGFVRRQAWLFGFSVLPALAAWIALLLNERQALALLVLCMLAQGGFDLWSSRRRQETLPEWYGSLRLLLTGIVCASLLTALAASVLRGGPSL